MLIAVAAIVIIAVIIFVVTCFYASWESRIDRRRQRRLDDRVTWDALEAFHPGIPGPLEQVEVEWLKDAVDYTPPTHPARRINF